MRRSSHTMEVPGYHCRGRLEPRMKKAMSIATSKPRAAAKNNGTLHRRRIVAPRDLEDEVLRLARDGSLAAAGREAIKAQRAAGLPITYKRGNKIVRDYPDG